MTLSRNRYQWLQIAAALDKHPQRDLFDHARRVAVMPSTVSKQAPASGKRSAAAGVAR
jgi:hypothetical protein